VNTPDSAQTSVIDSSRFRRVLGNYPTGVSVVTAIDEDGQPAGMAVGTFTSVSLDPPLIAFLPDRRSSSFPRIRTASSFCVNVLAADQEDACRAFATRGGDKFAGISWSPAPSGAPRLNGAAAWIDCDIESITDAGDHFLVMGRVRELDAPGDALPLVFFQGGYGRFSPHSLVAIPEADVVSHLRHADLARTAMERLSDELEIECTAVAPVGDQLVVVASSGRSANGTRPTRVGQRSPFLPPLGPLFLANADSAAFNLWLSRADYPDEQLRDAQRARLDRVRRRGWSLSLTGTQHTAFERALGRYSNGHRTSEDLHEIQRLAVAADDLFDPADIDDRKTYDVRSIAAPVTGSDGTPVLHLALWGLLTGLTGESVTAYITRLRAAADDVSRTIRAQVR
jgi:flavin reductase (DIM6/NTAB) family NADH-FMN oxidoreductase RutF